MDDRLLILADTEGDVNAEELFVMQELSAGRTFENIERAFGVPRWKLRVQHLQFCVKVGAKNRLQALEIYARVYEK